MTEQELNSRLERAQKWYNDVKAGKDVGHKNQAAIKAAIDKQLLRWGLTRSGGFKPLVPGDPDYDKGYASPKEALHFVSGEEPGRTWYNKLIGSTVAPVSQHRQTNPVIAGNDPIRADQRSGIADYAQDAGRITTKFALPLALAFGAGSKVPGLRSIVQRAPILGRAGAGTASSLIGAVNTPVSEVRHDPYGQPFGQDLVTALATGLGIALGRRYTPNQQAYRDAEQKVIGRLSAIGEPAKEGKRIANAAAQQLVHGLPAMTYKDYRYEPLRDFDTKFATAAETPTMLDPVAPVIEGHFDKSGKFVGSKVKARRPIPIKETTTTEGVKTTQPGGKTNKVVTEQSTVTAPEKTTETKTTTLTKGGKSIKQSDKSVVNYKMPTISDEEARQWLIQNHISTTEPGAIDNAKKLLQKAYLNPQSQEGLILFGTKGNRINLPKQDLTKFLGDETVNPILQELLRERSYFDDPAMDKEWKAARKQFGSRSKLMKEHGIGETSPIVSAEEFNRKRTSLPVRLKSVGAGVTGILLPILAEQLYNKVADNAE